MDYSSIGTTGSDLIVGGLRNFSLAEIVDSGQCFRWQTLGDGWYRGIAHGRVLRVRQEGEALRLCDVDEDEFDLVWRDYFDLSRDYGAIKEALCVDPALRQAVAFCPGMRVLRQEPWETLCSFILSQNNHIARIKGLVARLSALCGEPLEEGLHAFPTPQALAACTPEDLAPVRCGFRTRYLLDAAQKVASGELALEPLYALDAAEAEARLRVVRGVGPKVAHCVLLYGFARIECLPVDVWIGRALEEFFPAGFPEELTPWAGIAQQYLFHYIRLRDPVASPL